MPSTVGSRNRFADSVRRVVDSGVKRQRGPVIQSPGYKKIDVPEPGYGTWKGQVEGIPIVHKLSAELEMMIPANPTYRLVCLIEISRAAFGRRTVRQTHFPIANDLQEME